HYSAHTRLHSFPTRRSSDLTGRFKQGANLGFCIVIFDRQLHVLTGRQVTDYLDVTFTNPLDAIRKGDAILRPREPGRVVLLPFRDRKSTRLNSSHLGISYAV